MGFCCHSRTVSWFSCYPSACGSDGCCCNGTNCSAACDTTSTCGRGACCTCNDAADGFAWPGPGGLGCGGSDVCQHSVACGELVYFSNSSWINYGVVRVDSGPACSVNRAADLTKAFFMNLAPLSQGIITNMSIGDYNCFA